MNSHSPLILPENYEVLITDIQDNDLKSIGDSLGVRRLDETEKQLDIFIEEGMIVKVATLPQGFDPDLFVRKNGIAAFKQKIEEAQNLFDYKLDILKSRHNIKEAEGKAKIASDILPTIKKFKNSVTKLRKF